MRTYLMCVRENWLAWLGYALVALGILFLSQAMGDDGWWRIAGLGLIVLPSVGIVLVAFTAFSTLSFFEKAYRGIELRNGRIDVYFEEQYDHQLPCPGAGFRVAVRKWERENNQEIFRT